jgi:hypothetical protein
MQNFKQLSTLLDPVASHTLFGGSSRSSVTAPTQQQIARDLGHPMPQETPTSPNTPTAAMPEGEPGGLRSIWNGFSGTDKTQLGLNAGSFASKWLGKGFTAAGMAGVGKGLARVGGLASGADNLVDGAAALMKTPEQRSADGADISGNSAAGRAFIGAVNPISTIGAAAAHMADGYNDWSQRVHEANQQTEKHESLIGQQLQAMQPMYERWRASGAAPGPWTDPVSGKPFNSEDYRKLKEYHGQDRFTRDNRGANFWDRTTYTLMNPLPETGRKRPPVAAESAEDRRAREQLLMYTQ